MAGYGRISGTSLLHQLAILRNARRDAAMISGSEESAAADHGQKMSENTNVCRLQLSGVTVTVVLVEPSPSRED